MGKFLILGQTPPVPKRTTLTLFQDRCQPQLTEACLGIWSAVTARLRLLDHTPIQVDIINVLNIRIVLYYSRYIPQMKPPKHTARTLRGVCVCTRNVTLSLTHTRVESIGCHKSGAPSAARPIS